MARKLSPITPPTLAADYATVTGLQTLIDYQPVNPNYSITNLLQLQTTLAQAKQRTRELEAALDEARALEAQTSHAFHNATVGARAFVLAQYGPDSPAVEIVGLTRKSNYRRPVRRKANDE